MRLADTLAAERAQEAWRGIDAPGARPTVAMLRHALSEGLPGDVELDDLADWAQPQLSAIAAACNFFEIEKLFLGAIVSAAILGAKLQETAGT